MRRSTCPYALPSPDAGPKEVSAYLCRWFDSAQRPVEFLNMHRRVFARRRWRGAGPAFWRWLAGEWSGFDAIPHDAYIEQFMRWYPDWTPDIMDAANRSVYDALPDEISVYRGQDSSHEVGYSWTTDRDVAEKFAHGTRWRNGSPVVISGRIRKDAVLFAVNDREEAELVLLFLPYEYWIADGYPPELLSEIAW
jgi:hypothetical protein